MRFIGWSRGIFEYLSRHHVMLATTNDKKMCRTQQRSRIYVQVGLSSSACCRSFARPPKGLCFMQMYVDQYLQNNNDSDEEVIGDGDGYEEKDV